MTKKDVRKILEWTTPIDPGYIRKNSNNKIVTTTKYAFEMEDEQLKIHTLQFIYGIGLPTASRILMLYDPKKYTVLNDASIYTMKKWNYIKENDLKLNLETWELFTNEFRELSRKLKIDGIKFFKISSSLYSHYYLKEDYLPHLKLENFF